MASGAKIWAMMDSDWQQACAHTAQRPTPPAWRDALPARAVPPAIREHLLLADLCELVGRRDDEVTVGLIRLCQCGEQLAGRVVVQAMLPSLWAISQRDPAHDFADYVGAAWIRVKTFPVDRRPHAVLTNLSLDCLKTLSRQSVRERQEVSTSHLEGDLAWCSTAWSTDETTKYVEELLTLAARHKLVSAICVGVLQSVYRDGLTGREAALRHSISHDMVRYYCSSAIRVLRNHRLELIEALGAPV